MQIFNRSTIHLILMDIALDSPTFSMLNWSIRNIFTMRPDLSFCLMRDKLPDKRRDKLLAILCDKIRYVTHYRNLQRYTRHGLRIKKFTAYCNFRNLHDFVLILGLTRILEHLPRTILRKIYTNWWIMQSLAKPWRTCAITLTCDS